MGNIQFIEHEGMLTDAVKAAFDGTTDPRLKEVMAAFVDHVHAFVREVQLTEQELEVGLSFIAAIGQGCTDSHNEAVLASDVLSISTLVSLLNHPEDQGQTTAALLGSFCRLNAPVFQN